MGRTIHISTIVALCAFGTVVFGQGQQGRQAGTMQDGYNGRVRAIESAVTSYFNPPEIMNLLTPGGFSEWSLTLKKGQVVISSARSDAFDPALEIVIIDDDGVEEVLAKNDDRYPGDQRPLLMWRCEEDGDYKLRARCFEDKAGGQFFLKTKTYESMDPVEGKPTEMTVEGEKRFLVRIPMKAGEIKQVFFDRPDANEYPPVSIGQFVSSTGLPDINLMQPISSAAHSSAVMAPVDGDYYLVVRTRTRGTGKVHAYCRDVETVELEREDGQYSAKAAINALSLWSLDVNEGDILEVSLPELSLSSKFASAEYPDISKYDLEDAEHNPFFPQADDEEEDKGPVFVGLPARAGDPRIGIYVIKRDAKLWFASDGRGAQAGAYTLAVRPAPKEFTAEDEIEGQLRIAYTDYWQFDAKAGDVMTFNSGSSAFSEQLVVFDPDLREVKRSSLGLDTTSMAWDMIVRKPGRYLVAVSALGDGASGTYTLKRNGFSAREFGMDSPAEGDFSTGDVEIWKFTATPDRPLYVHWESESRSYSVSVRDENGAGLSLPLTTIDPNNQFGILKVSKPTTFLIVLMSDGKKSDYKITLNDLPGYVKEGAASSGNSLEGAGPGKE